MKSPLNTHIESNVTNTLASDQARILKGILGLVILVFFLLIALVVALDNSKQLLIAVVLLSLSLSISISLLVYLSIDLNQLHQKKYYFDLILKNQPLLKYIGNQYVSVYAFSDSLLYDEVDFFYKGSDLLKSENWEVSNLKVKCRTRNTNKENKVFKGCFFSFKKSLAIQEPIIIKPKIIGPDVTIPKVLNHLMNPYFNPNADQIVTGYSDFDQLFDIYTLNAKETTSFLSEGKMKDILSFYNNLKQIVEKQSSKNKNRIFKPKFDKPLNALELSFHKDGIYLAIREQKIFSLLKESMNTKHQNIILDLIKYLDKI
ncbi:MULTISPECIES: DUF3137 domain-containing protein [unclassified Lentimicrobium]|uniref:DUF3137 domain-containing protein n=1 Tax=unclassified Lentimicrobium TaxID=2677434 RepID=UPI001555EFCC|nr:MULTISPECIES: DUF3137 domain-containing protein [unclassified Lentimicrobium]NPD44632.1 DUF3137 domain-containing protein [Lentimicrobium sp. S6]NPD83344.1 DUF3137 domain-containing protein [Lentimicrobium sp. L6]